MVSDRSLAVLRVIVQDYVSTSEPVGSKSIVERHSFGVSSATIRNDMAQLEEDGLIAAPHTSSGRIPTDKGYRVFVDQLTELRPLSTAQRSAIEAFLAHWTADRLVAGQVYVNDWWVGGVETPFGGAKRSGYGREKGQEALLGYVQTKSVGIRY